MQKQTDSTIFPPRYWHHTSNMLWHVLRKDVSFQQPMTHSNLTQPKRSCKAYFYYQWVVLKIWFGLFTKLKQSPKNGSNRQRADCISMCGACVLHSLNSQWERMCCFQKDKKRIISSFRYNEHSELPFNLQFYCFAVRTQVKFEAQSPSYAKSTFSFPQLQVDFIYHVWCG